MNNLCLYSRCKRIRRPLAGLFVFLFLLISGACGGSSSVEVYDNARVLDTSRVQRAAQSLPNPLAIYTTNTFRGTRADFQQVARQKLKGNPDLIVMAIDTGHRYLYITRGSNVALSNAGIRQAVNSFSARFNDGDYTGASVAALYALQRSINAHPRSRANSGGGLLTGPTLLCCVIPLLILLFLVLFVASRRRRTGQTLFRRSPFGQRGSPFDQPPDQGMYPAQPGQGMYPAQPGQGMYPAQPGQGMYPAQPGQGMYPAQPGQGMYPAQPGQGGGMNPWAAGGLGAAAGGLAGYELGRRLGEHKPQRDDEPGEEAGGGGSFGDNTGSSWDTGGGSDFGSDEFDQGGGGNF